MPINTPLNQIAYAADDVRAFAREHSRLYGSGPFLVMEGFEVSCELRGEQITFTNDVAFGQWGDMQVEVMHQVNPGKGLIHDLFPEGSGRFGVHHFLNLVDDLPAAIAHFEEAGYEIIFRGAMPQGTNVVMIDTARTLGHVTELYEYSDEIRGLFEAVKNASVGFDGTDPVRPIADYLGADSGLGDSARSSETWE